MVRPQRFSASGAISTDSRRIGTIVLTAGAGAAASATILSTPTATTNTAYYACEVKALTGDTKSVNFVEDGLELEDGSYLTLSGSGAVAYIYYL